jgi:hypothetical protein
MTKQELDNFIESTKYCINNDGCDECPATTKYCSSVEKIRVMLPIIKDYRQLKYGEIDTAKNSK